MVKLTDCISTNDMIFLTLHVAGSASKRKAKPAGVREFEVAWAILKTSLSDWEQLTHPPFSNVYSSPPDFQRKLQHQKTLYFVLH
jgi:hypothetical protein